MSDLYRLVYASKNLVQSTEADKRDAVDQILSASQANNARVGVTGALMFNAGAFAQVLEGPRRGVEDTFERIQQDPRHGDVTVLQCGPVEARGFTNWSMAFVGASPKGRELWSNLAAQSGFELSRLSGDAVFTMLHDLVQEEEGSAPPTGSIPAADQDEATVPLNVEQLRVEIAQIRPEQPASRLERAHRTEPALVASEDEKAARSANPARGALDATIMVLKAALAAERQLTTELKNSLDDARISIVEAVEQRDQFERERDLWANRAKLLATAIRDEAALLTGGFNHEALLTSSTNQPCCFGPDHITAA